MAWESIGDVGAHLMLKITSGDFPLYEERTGEQASAMDSAQPAAAEFVAAAQGEANSRPARGGRRADLNEKGRGKAPRQVKGRTPGGGEILRLPPTIGRDMTTARPNELPRSAVVISLAMYRAQWHGQNAPRARRMP